MKKLKPITVFILFFLIFSCEKNSNEIVSTSTPKADQIGIIHNELLFYHYNTSKSAHDIVSNIESYLIEIKKFDSDVVIESLDSLRKYDEFGLFTDCKSTGLIDFNEYLISISEYISPKLLKKIEGSWSFGKDIPAETIKEYVIAEIGNQSWSEQNDSIFSAVFVDVFLNSYEYWNTEYKSSAKLKNSSKVILADALGSLHGLIFGPVGSIIEGAVTSIITNEKLN